MRSDQLVCTPAGGHGEVSREAGGFKYCFYLCFTDKQEHYLNLKTMNFSSQRHAAVDQTR